MAGQVLSVASMMPDISLPSAPSGVPVGLRECGGKITVLVTAHSAECGGCREYLSGLGGSAPEFDVWEARLLVTVPEDLRGAARLSIPFGKVLGDSGRALAETGSASVMVIDRYGQVFHAAGSGAGHDLPSPRELEEWLKYLGTLCPE